MTARSGHVGMRRFVGTLNLVLFLLSVLAIGVVLNFFSMRPDLRRQIDATKTRAYSLSPQTRGLLERLEGPWTIALLRSERQTEPGLKRQIDEVLRRFADTAPDLTVQHIDPTDPASLAAYDALVGRLQSIYGPLAGQYDLALDEGERAFEALQRYAQLYANQLQVLAGRIPAEQASEHQLPARAAALGIVASEGGKVLKLVRDARAVTDLQSIPDYESARSILHAALREWSRQIDDLALIFQQLAGRTDLDTEVRQFLASARAASDSMSQQLATATDPLGRLEPLELSSIGRRLQEGECAVVIGPARAAAIRASQLYPAAGVQAAADSPVTFDQRFRGEQLFASTIRSLLQASMPLVIFVHASQHTMLMPTDNQADLVGMKSVLTTARFDVREWPVARSLQTPDVPRGRTAVWVVVPPSEPPSAANQEAWSRLVTVARDLVEDGEPVMLNIYPSRMARFGQRDAWVDAIGLLGVQADTSRAIVEQVRAGGGQTLMEFGQRTQEYPGEHVIASAIEGLTGYFTLPVPLAPREGETGAATHTPLVHVMPAPTRWLEANWHQDAGQLAPPGDENRFADPQTLALAIERPHPAGAGRQRCVVVGSGGWMLSAISDRVYSIGGGRIVLEFPGNYEFMLAALAWMAGQDELIAPSPMSQEVPRLRNLTTADRRRWFWLSVAVLPGACIGLGVLTWLVRRF